MYETEREAKAKAKRMIELDDLIRDAETRLSLYSDDPARVAAERKARRWLMLEKEFYKRGHAFNTWPSMLADMKERERQSEAEAAELAKSEAASAAEAEARRSARDAAERAQWEKDNDPFILAKRAKAARTF